MTLFETFCRVCIFIFSYNNANAELAESKSKLCLRQNNVKKVSRQMRKTFLGFFEVLEEQKKNFCEFRGFCGIDLTSFES